MEEIALGEMQMSEAELNAISLRSLVNKLVGFRKKEETDWEKTRIQTFLMLSPYMDRDKPLLPQEIWPMPWDNEIIEKAVDKAKEQREKAKEAWAKIDSWAKK